MTEKNLLAQFKNMKNASRERRNRVLKNEVQSCYNFALLSYNITNLFDLKNLKLTSREMQREQ